MLKKSFAAALAVVIAGFAGTSGLAKAESLVNGIDANFPPFAYVDKSGAPSGFDVDSLNWIAKSAGFTVSHKPVDWDGIIPNLVAKKIDVICSGMSITAERAKVVNFTKPYWEVKNVFVVKKDAKTKVDDIVKGATKIGVQQGTAEGDWLQKQKDEKGGKYTLRMYDSAPMAVEDVLNGRIDAAFMNEPPAKDAVAKKAVKIVGSYGEIHTFGCAVRKEDKALLDKLNAGYAKLMADPFWKELVAKYKP